MLSQHGGGSNANCAGTTRGHRRIVVKERLQFCDIVHRVLTNLRVSYVLNLSLCTLSSSILRFGQKCIHIYLFKPHQANATAICEQTSNTFCAHSKRLRDEIEADFSSFL